MTTRIEARWHALTPALDKPIFQLLDAEHPLKLYIGREMTGQFLFLVVDPEQPPEINSMRSVQVSALRRQDGHWSMILKLNQPELAGVFGLLCEDLVSSSRHLTRGTTGMKMLCRRLVNWRRLLEEGGDGLLSPSEIRGLFGELWILDRVFLDNFEASEAVVAWVGPLAVC